MRIKLKKEKGFTTIDVSIAMMIAVVFVAIMSSMLYSVYTSSTESKRTAMALNYAVDIFERIGAVSYDNVEPSIILHSLQTANVSNLMATSDGMSGEIGTYKINLKIEEQYEDESIKLITLTITYPISAKKTETMKMQRIKINEKRIK